MDNLNFWQTLYVSLIPSFLTALISAIVSIYIAKKQRKSEMEKLRLEYQIDILKMRGDAIFAIKKDALFDALTILDTYISWLTIDKGKVIAERKETTPLELTVQARKCFNELCVTSERSEVPKLFSDIIFEGEKNIFKNYAEFRNLVRMELGLEETDFNKERIFFGRISTDDLEKCKD